jgi:hypothetical protein
LLNGRLELHGVEPFVDRIVSVTLKRRNIVLSEHRREDLLAYAVAELWVASGKFDPARYSSFQQFADSVVRRRVIDFFRAELGRSRWQFGTHVYERERPLVLSLDAPLTDGGGSLRDTLAGRTLDLGEPGLPDRLRRLSAGALEGSWPDTESSRATRGRIAIRVVVNDNGQRREKTVGDWRLSPPLFERLVALADEEGRSLSAQLTFIAEVYLQESSPDRQ